MGWAYLAGYELQLKRKMPKKEKKKLENCLFKLQLKRKLPKNEKKKTRKLPLQASDKKES